MRMPFGKHSGAEIKDLPGDYLKWLYEEVHILSEPLWKKIHQEYARRWGRKKAERFRLERHGQRKPTRHRRPRKQQRQEQATPKSRRGPVQEIADSQPQLFRELIEAGYRTLAKRYHPDVAPGDTAAAEKMRLLNRIMETLRGLP